MKAAYLAVLYSAERLHRRALELIQGELARSKVLDLNAAQAMLLINIGDEEMSIGGLAATGGYLGSTLTYNLKKLTESGYLVQTRSERDRRIVTIKLSGKGRSLVGEVDQFLSRIGTEVEHASIGLSELEACASTLRRLERLARQQSEQERYCARGWRVPSMSLTAPADQAGFAHER